MEHPHLNKTLVLRVSDDAERWVSKQTFIELWEHYQKALTELQELSQQIKSADQKVGWLASEVLRIGDLARAYSDRADSLKGENDRLTLQLQTQIEMYRAYRYEAQRLRDQLANGQGGQL